MVELILCNDKRRDRTDCISATGVWGMRKRSSPTHGIGQGVFRKNLQDIPMFYRTDENTFLMAGKGVVGLLSYSRADVGLTLVGLLGEER